MEETCSIGFMLNGAECSGNGLINISTLCPEEQELLQLRCSTLTFSEESTICERHQMRFLKLFEIHQRKCCDPFRKHKKAITSKKFDSCTPFFIRIT